MEYIIKNIDKTHMVINNLIDDYQNLFIFALKLAGSKEDIDKLNLLYEERKKHVAEFLKKGGE